MRVEVDGPAMLAVAAALADRAGAVRRQAAACERVPDGVVEPRLRPALDELADTAGDVLAVAALDLGLLAGKVRAAAGSYGGFEQGLTTALAQAAGPAR